jgi:hypothetical protein
VRTELSTLETLRSTTLRDLGVAGKAMISVRHVKTSIPEEEVLAGNEDPQDVALATPPVAETDDTVTATTTTTAAPMDVDVDVSEEVTAGSANSEATAVEHASTLHVPAAAAASTAAEEADAASSAASAAPQHVTTAASQHAAVAAADRAAEEAAKDSTVAAAQRADAVASAYQATTAAAAFEAAVEARVAALTAGRGKPAPQHVDPAAVEKVKREWTDAQRVVAEKRAAAARVLAQRAAAQREYEREAVERAAQRVAAKAKAASAAMDTNVASKAAAAADTAASEAAAAAMEVFDVPPREVKVFLRPETMTTAIGDVDDEFFNVTARELRRMLTDAQRQQQTSDTPLLTQALRDRQEQEKIARFKTATLRVCHDSITSFFFPFAFLYVVCVRQGGGSGGG